jgi:hypothetical protein
MHIFPQALRASASQGAGAVEGAAYDARYYTAVILHLACTAHSGTNPVLDVIIQGHDPTSDTWFDLVTFTQSTTAVSAETKYVGTGAGTTLLPASIRVKGTVGGTATPTKTFSVGAIFHR